uniref:EGF-like domain-containing protein n=1 Tax=Heterorhabditis bacteriophora TaxID=37862 RepID=A0A1I7XPS4_HETBA
MSAVGAEVCISSSKCGCRPGQARASSDDKCEEVTEVPIVVRVIDFDDEPLHYSTDYSKPSSPENVQVVDSAVKGLGEVFRHTDVAPRYVTTDVNYITNPKVENSSWDHGLLINGSVKLSGNDDIDQCNLFQQFADQIKARQGKIDRLKVAEDFTLLDPCRWNLGICLCMSFVIITSSLNSLQISRILEMTSTKISLVGKDYSPNYDLLHINLIIVYSLKKCSRFETGIAQSYDKTPLKSGFVTAEVNEIQRPNEKNASWINGLLYNFTSHFVRGSVGEPSTVFTDLIEYIGKKNGYEVGTSKLFISPDQANPFSSCYHSDCHPSAICKELGKGYSCECPSGFRDLNPSRPGRQCLSYRGVNECEKPELNECSPDARCIDLDYLYKCECVSPYVNAAPQGAIPGSVCSIDYCSDVNFCPLNSTCKNVDEQARCDCNAGFVDLRKSDKLSEAGLGETICLRHTDVDECVLGLHNCSAAAICTDKKFGYDCRCPDGYSDGNPSEPGRICAALLCGLCNGHGDCIHDSLTNNVTCACVDGYSGEFCEVAPSNIGLILMTILALLFLLLTLLCCLYACARCSVILPNRCFRARGISEGSASGQEILGSDYYTIPRAKLKPGYGDETIDRNNAGALAAYLDDGGSVSSDGSLEEIERKITTDVTTREVRTTTVRDEHGNVISQRQMVSHGPLETDTEQYAVTSSDHFRHASGSAGAMRSDSRTSRSVYESDEESVDSDAGHATYDRTTRTTHSHDFEPGRDPRTGVERRKNEYVTTTKAEEVNYF